MEDACYVVFKQVKIIKLEGNIGVRHIIGSLRY